MTTLNTAYINNETDTDSGYTLNEDIERLSAVGCGLECETCITYRADAASRIASAFGLFVARGGYDQDIEQQIEERVAYEVKCRIDNRRPVDGYSTDFGAGNKIRAIKWFREITGFDLKEAKDACESIWSVYRGASTTISSTTQRELDTMRNERDDIQRRYDNLLTDYSSISNGYDLLNDRIIEQAEAIDDMREQIRTLKIQKELLIELLNSK